MKTLSLLVYPLGIVMVLLVFALALLLWGRRRLGIGLLTGSILLLWVFSMPAVGNWLVWQLEREWSYVAVEELPRADAVVVLGGAFSSGNGQWTYPSAGGTVDRYWHAARIYHADRAPLVIVSGGRQPHLSGGMTEAESGALFLGDMGIPEEALILDKASLTTAEHFDNLREIMRTREIRTLLVVTSASHMQRSLATLGRLDVRLTPVATDFSAIEDPPFILRDWLPAVSGLSRSTRAFHELLGLWYYRLTGRA
ncbi:MAG: YdcF family protein [Pseudomonadota bacterium]|nr:MAG: YdcF family protein [Pseudomonadota bacterium]